MKKLSLFLSALSISLCSFSQVMVNITSVPCNTGLEGSYPFTYVCVDNDGGGCLDWGVPDIFLSQNAVAGPLEFINDSTPGTVSGVGVPPLVGVPKGYLGCDTLGNPTQDLTGKIAVIYRGTCEYGLKAYNAQKRGAIGVIIINHTGDPVAMAGGTYGSQDTIPIVMIGRIAGDDLRLAIESCTPNSVTGFIGSKVGFYANDMGSSMGDILMPENLTTPITIATNGVNFPVDLGLWAFNYGSNTQNGVVATVDVQFGGLSVYTQTSLPINYIAPIGNILDTQFIELGTYAPTTWNVGTYSVTYTLNNANDGDISDNTFSFEFVISDIWGNGGYAKARTDNVDNPIFTKTYSLPINNNEWEICLNLKIRNTPLSFEGIIFVASSLSATVTEVVDFKVYKWNDVFLDLNSPPTFNNLVLLDSLQHTLYDLSEAETVELVYFHWSAFNLNQRYLFCLNSNSPNLRLGFDEGINYKATANHYQEPISPIRTRTTSGVDIWDYKGIGYGSIPSIYLLLQHLDTEPCNFPPFPCVGLDENGHENAIMPYPNPTANLLNVPIRKGVTGNVLVELFDLAGRLLLSENKTIGSEPLKVNVVGIQNGAYVFKLTFVDGTKEVFKISVNR